MLYQSIKCSDWNFLEFIVYTQQQHINGQIENGFTKQIQFQLVIHTGGKNLFSPHQCVNVLPSINIILRLVKPFPYILHWIQFVQRVRSLFQFYNVWYAKFTRSISVQHRWIYWIYLSIFDHGLGSNRKVLFANDISLSFNNEFIISVKRK